ncbi:replication initiation protein [Rufibacter ruber]|uniref:replication initiation protein n=1 Tax=Rufibacter ruber TaxID=1783499 RepID=UPI0008371D16|nr:replication initiation protein [Rufibacter ruber]
MKEDTLPEWSESELQPIIPDLVPLRNPHSIVTQSNDLINAYFDMSTVQLRAFVYAVGHIHKKDKDLTAVKIPIKALYSGEGGKNYRNTVKLAQELQKVDIKILKLVKDGEGTKRQYEAYTIFPTVKYTEDSKYIVTRINPDLKQFLINLNGNYTQAELTKLLSLKTIQAYRIYMFIKMNIDKSKGKIPETFKVDYKEFRLMLGLDVIEDAAPVRIIKPKSAELNLFGEPTSVQILSVKPKVKVLKYAEFDNFKKRILKTAQTELKEAELLDFDFEADKQGGRSVKYVTFKLRPNIVLEQPEEKPKPKQVSSPQLDGLTPNQKIVYDRMLKYHFEEDKAYRAVTQAVDLANLLVYINQEMYYDKKSLAVVWVNIEPALVKKRKLDIRGERWLDWTRKPKPEGWIEK